MAQAHLARTLVAQTPYRRMLLVDHAGSAPVVWSRMATGRLRRLPETDAVRHLRPLRLRRQDPRSDAGLRRTYRRYTRQLARAARRNDLVQPTVLTTNALLAAYGDFDDWDARVVYYATDDFAVPGRRLSAVYADAYPILRDRGVDVAAVTGEIVRRIDPAGRALVVPNGIEPSEWRDDGDPPAWFAALPRPRLLYVGVLMDRVDPEIVRRLSAAYREGSIVFVGPNHAPEHFSFAETLENVTIHAPVGRGEIVRLVRGADVGIVPHYVNDFTRGMSPLKVYEYLAGGLPVVTVDLPEMRRLGGRVIVCEPDRVADGAGRALAMGRAAESDRERFIEQNSWGARYEALLDFADDSEPRPLVHRGP
jgi:glycosyltransferase involved in cell wall biosynthesis